MLSYILVVYIIRAVFWVFQFVFLGTVYIAANLFQLFSVGVSTILLLVDVWRSELYIVF